MANLLSIGRTGLNVSKKSLATTGHNIANANTEGYSRQRVVQTNSTPIQRGGMIEGSGARIVGIRRYHDQYIEKQLKSTISKESYDQQHLNQLTEIENIFNEVNGDGLNQILGKFYNSFRELANQPENETIRSMVRDNAELVVRDFRRIRQTLNSISRRIGGRVAAEVKDINGISDSIAKYNQKIAELEAVGGESGDLRDQRDLAVRNLSKYFKITTYLDERGQYVVLAKNVGTLVTASIAQELVTGPVPKKYSSSNTDGSIEIYFKGRVTRPITEKFQLGTIASQIAIRNHDLRTLQNDIDTIAFEFTNTVNAVHRRGIVNRQVEVDMNGNTLPYDEKGPVRGINFFAELISQDGAAENIDLSEAVKNDLSNITTALNPNAPSDNRVAIAISKLQHERVMDGGRATLEEKYLQTIGLVGLATGKARVNAEQSEGLLVQAQALRERLAGVSIDEETANLVKYQHAYEASAKVIQVANEMFKTILSLKR